MERGDWEREREMRKRDERPKKVVCAAQRICRAEIMASGEAKDGRGMGWVVWTERKAYPAGCSSPDTLPTRTGAGNGEVQGLRQ